MARTKAVDVTATDISDSLQIFDEMEKSYSAFKSKNTVIDCIDTGSPALNNAIGISGFPRGRTVQVYGTHGSGKSFLTLNCVKQMVKNDPTATCIWFDTERSFNYVWAKKMGIWDEDPKKTNIRVLKGARGVEIFEKIVGKIKKDKFGSKKVQNGILDFVKEGKINCPLIVIDSLGAIISPREEDAPVGGFTVGALAGFLTAELKRMSGAIEEANTCLVCINQVRQSLDAGAYDDQFHFPGGESLKHQMSLNLYVERRTSADDVICTEEKNKNTLIGQKVKIVVKKNRFAPTPRTCETTLLFTEGAGYDSIGIVDIELEVIDIASSKGLITGGGAWYNFNNEKFQGKKKLQEYLKANPKIMDDLISSVNTASKTIVVDEVEEIFSDSEE